MTSDSRLSSARFLWVPFALVLAALVLRWVKLESPGMNLLPNFSPWMALAFTGTLLFRQGSLPWWSWPLMLLGVDLAVMGGKLWSWSGGGLEIFLTYGLFTVAALAASRLRGRAGIWQSLLGVAACSIVFYVVTNTLSWWVMPEYGKNLAGLVQALTTGVPGYPPTWMFLRNSLLSDLGFSALLLAAFNLEASLRSVPRIRWATA